MEGFLWKQRFLEGQHGKGNLRKRYVTLNVEDETLRFKVQPDDANFHKIVPLDQVAEVGEYGENGFLVRMREVATAEDSGAIFLYETETDGPETRDVWLSLLRQHVDVSSCLHLIVRTEQSIHERYSTMVASARGAVLGTGMSGDVRLVQRKTDHKLFAMKTIGISNVSQAKVGCLRREIDILKSLDHPHIVRLQEIFIEPKLCFRLVMEVCEGGEIFERLTKVRSFSEAYAARLLKTMLKALNYLYLNHIVHRDLKLENWLFRTPLSDSANIEDDVDIVLIDFGLSHRYREGQVMTKKVGTCYYVAPEVLKGRYSGNTCDMWSLGVIAYMLLSGVPPFDGRLEGGETRNRKAKKFEEEIIRDKVLNQPLPDFFMDESLSQVSNDAKDFITKLLVKDPRLRAKTPEALTHHWLQKHSRSSQDLSKVEESSVEDAKIEIIDGSVLECLKNFTKYKELKRLAMEVIAFSLDHKEIKDLSRTFEALDKDEDGYITFEELLEGIRSSPNLSVSDEEIRQIFDALDEENNGHVHVNEFVAGALQAKYHREELHLAEAFSRMDTSSKGKITVEDLKHLLGRSASEERVRKIWEQGSLANKSGKDEITFHEFLVFMRTDGESNVEGYLEQAKTSRRKSFFMREKRRENKLLSKVSKSTGRGVLLKEISKTAKGDEAKLRQLFKSMSMQDGLSDAEVSMPRSPNSVAGAGGRSLRSLMSIPSRAKGSGWVQNMFNFKNKPFNSFRRSSSNLSTMSIGRKLSSSSTPTGPAGVIARRRFRRVRETEVNLRRESISNGEALRGEVS